MSEKKVVGLVKGLRFVHIDDHLKFLFHGGKIRVYAIDGISEDCVEITWKEPNSSVTESIVYDMGTVKRQFEDAVWVPIDENGVVKDNTFNRIRNRAKPENKLFVRLSVDISERVRSILKTHQTIKTEADLARAMGKEDVEVNAMLSGTYNMNLEDISKMTVVLGEDIINVSNK